MAEPIIAQKGDIVVARRYQTGDWVYVLHIVHGRDQVLVRSRDDAVAEAIAFARRERVRAWIADDHDAYQLLDDFRTPS